MVAFKQIYYSVEIEEPATAGSFFASSHALSNSDFERQGEIIPPVYVRSVDYGRLIVVQMQVEATLTEVHLSEATLADLAANLSQLLEVYISVEECAMAVSDFCEALSNDGFLVFHRARESLG